MISAIKLAKKGAAVAAFSTLCISSAFAVTHTIDFDQSGITHGTVLNTQYQSIGVTISGINQSNGSRNGNYAVAYDSTPGTSSTKSSNNDADLTGPNWGAGNIATNNLQLGNVLIIQETKRGSQTNGCSAGQCQTPDDEGDRSPAAGDLIFDFNTAITEFGMDLIDVEGPNEYGNNKGYVAAFFDSLGTNLGQIGFADFLTRDNAVYGNNSVNRISPIDFANELSITSDVTRVVVNFGGSAALDNVMFSTKTVAVSEPASTSLLSLGIFAIWLRRKAMQKA